MAFVLPLLINEMKKLLIILLIGFASCNDSSKVKRLVKCNVRHDLRTIELDTLYHVGENVPAEVNGLVYSCTIIR